MSAGNEALSQVLADVTQLEGRLAILRRSIYQGLRSTELPAGKHDIVLCQLGDDIFGLPLDRVDAVAPFCALMPVPETTGAVVGLLDFHGENMPVLDMHAGLGGQPRAAVASDVLVICSGEDRRAALLVHGVVGVRWAVEISDDVHRVPHAAYVLGTARLSDRSVVVFSVSRLFAAMRVATEARS